MVKHDEPSTILPLTNINDTHESFSISGKLHSPCVMRIATLTDNDNKRDYYLDLTSVKGCPDYIHYNNITYNYKGVSDGISFYVTSNQKVKRF